MLSQGTEYTKPTKSTLHIAKPCILPLRAAMGHGIIVHFRCSLWPWAPFSFCSPLPFPFYQFYFWFQPAKRSPFVLCLSCPIDLTKINSHLLTPTTGPTYSRWPLIKYINRLMTKTPTNITTLQLKVSNVVGVLPGQKDQKIAKITQRRAIILIGRPHFPKLQRLGGNVSG